MKITWPENYELPQGSHKALVWDISQRINPELGPSIYNAYDPKTDIAEETISPFGERSNKHNYLSWY